MSRAHVRIVLRRHIRSWRFLVIDCGSTVSHGTRPTRDEALVRAALDKRAYLLTLAKAKK